MNRRGHIGTVMLVIGAFILVVFALSVMVFKGNDFSLVRAELRASSDFSSASHKYVLKNFEEIINKAILESTLSNDFEKAFNESLKKYASEKRVGGLNNNLYAKIALGEYFLKLIDGKYELTVYGLTETYNLKNNEVKYNYGLKMVFDKSKVISITSIIEQDL